MESISGLYKLLFCTLTFPQDIDQKAANECFSNYIDNLKTNYNLNSYVAVKENTKRGRPHYHCLLDLPYQDFKILNKAWCAAFSGYMHYSVNAFTTGKRPIVDNVRTAVDYITKYITKCEQSQDEVKPETKQYFISQNVAARPELISDAQLTYFLITQAHEKFESEYFTWYKLTDFHCLPEKYRIKADSPKKKKPKKQRIIPINGRELPLIFPINDGYRVDFSH